MGHAHRIETESPPSLSKSLTGRAQDSEQRQTMLRRAGAW